MSTEEAFMLTEEAFMSTEAFTLAEEALTLAEAFTLIEEALTLAEEALTLAETFTLAEAFTLTEEALTLAEAFTLAETSSVFGAPPLSRLTRSFGAPKPLMTRIRRISPPSMENILERYERYSYAERQLVANDPDASANWTLEYSKLKSRIEILQRNQRHYLGEDLDSLSIKELQNLEQQLDTALKHIRSKKNQLMYESISELQKKEKAIQDQNSMLTRKIKEKEKTMTQQAQWEQQYPDVAANTTSFLLPQTFPGLNNGNGLFILRNEAALTMEKHLMEHEGTSLNSVLNLFIIIHAISAVLHLN